MKKAIIQSFYQWLMPCLFVLGFQQQIKTQTPGCLKATYFPNSSLSGLPTATRAETVIDFRSFAEISVRWEGTAIPPVSGAYTFTMTVDDGARLWVNNQLVVDKWLDVSSATTYTATVNLTQGQEIPIKLENYHLLGTGGIAQLFWTIPNQTSTLLPFKDCPVTAPLIDPTKCYRIVNKVSNKSLEIKDASTAEGAQIFQWATVENKANQLWQLTKLSDGKYTFKSKSSGKLIDAPDCTEGAVIKQYAADGTNSQRWTLELQADGSYKPLNASCNKYLRLESGSSANGASVGIKNDFGTNAFKWLIQEAVCPSVNPATASIKDVFVYADNNNDTHYNAGDAPISGVTVTLTNANNQIVSTAISGANGGYSFLNVAVGSYTLTFPATLADGKTITTRNPITLTLAAGQVFNNADAGYFKPISQLGRINGFVFEDKNKNLQYDTGDAPLSGLSILLRNNFSPYDDVAEMVTDINGNYSFTNVPAGSYLIISSYEFGSLLSSSLNVEPYTNIVNLSAGQIYKNPDRSYFKANTISGTVFGDENKNSRFDSGELPIPNSQITSTNISLSIPDLGAYPGTYTTDQNGNYALLLPNKAGKYNIDFPLFLPDGQRLTSPERVVVNVAQGQSVSGINGVYSALPSIYGRAYTTNYTNIETFIDLPVTLYDSNNVVIATTKTKNGSINGNYDGMYSFIDLKTGTYTVKFPDTLADGSRLAIPNPTKLKLVKGQHLKLTAHYLPPLGGVISSEVWYDRNEDGVLDRCSKGNSICDGYFYGVTVSLYDATGKFIKTGVTAVNDGTMPLGIGISRLFTGLKVGTYKIKFPDTLPHGARLLPGATTTVDIDYVGIGRISARYSYTNPIPSLAKNTLLNMSLHAEANRAQIQWVNNTGDQNDFFTVEKLNQTTEVFEKIETLHSKNTQTNEFYTVYDNTVTDGDNTYRVALTMLDGTVKTSEPQTVNFKNLNDIRIFPNPADEFINVDLRKYEGKTVALSVYNSVGLLVKKQTIEKVSAVPQQIDVQGFGTGSYLLRVQSEGKREVTRLFNIAK